ncbi:MAG: NAD(P)H-binding protein [Pseudomonadota bacterium]
MNVLIYGADGATGIRLVRQALEAGHRVRASVPDLESPPLQADGLDWVESDILDPETLRGDMAGIDAVLNAVGIEAGPSTLVSPPPLHSQGTPNILTAMRAAGVDRFVTISASFVETLARGPIWFEAAARLGLKPIFDDMAKMERGLKATDDIRWTAVRPGWLLNEAASGDFQVFDEVIPEDLIRTRTGDLAAFMLDCAENDLHIRATPAIARPEPASKSGPDAVLAEMVG